MDRDERLDQKVVVIDDPITSLDDHRARVTVEQIASFVPRTMQMIVLSHDKRFLLRILEKMDHLRDLDVKALEVVRDGQGSIVRDWNTDDDRITEHDRYHELLLT
jgi:wobble nucleotide-excising tRNase